METKIEIPRALAEEILKVLKLDDWQQAGPLAELLAATEAPRKSQPVAIVRHTKTDISERFDGVILASAILSGAVADGTKLYAAPLSPDHSGVTVVSHWSDFGCVNLRINGVLRMYVESCKPDHPGGAGVVVDERSEFEAWYVDWFNGTRTEADHRYDIERMKASRDGDHYGVGSLGKNLRWIGWQARARLDKVKELNQ